MVKLMVIVRVEEVNLLGGYENKYYATVYASVIKKFSRESRIANEKYKSRAG